MMTPDEQENLFLTAWTLGWQTGNRGREEWTDKDYVQACADYERLCPPEARIMVVPDGA